MYLLQAEVESRTNKGIFKCGKGIECTLDPLLKYVSEELNLIVSEQKMAYNYKTLLPYYHCSLSIYKFTKSS